MIVLFRNLATRQGAGRVVLTQFFNLTCRLRIAGETRVLVNMNSDHCVGHMDQWSVVWFLLKLIFFAIRETLALQP